MYKQKNWMLLIIIAMCILFPICVNADEELTIPEPLKVIDFSYSFEDISKSNPDFEVVNNTVAPYLIIDGAMGQVLKLQKTIVGERTYYSDKKVLSKDDSLYSTIKIDNPYAGQTHLIEYEPYEDVETDVYYYCIQPKWKEGITISYWIKVPEGVNSNVLGFKSDRFQVDYSDYSKHMMTIKFDLEYNKYTDEEKELLSINESGVENDSMFYFEYSESVNNMDKPVYVAEDKMGYLYWFNKNYVKGYIENGEGQINECTKNPCYEKYQIAPYLGIVKEDHNPGESNLRYGWTTGEMWLDASSSFYFAIDIYKSVQLNPNHTDSYGQEMYMQETNCFNINSWKKQGSYVEAIKNETAGPSPVKDCNQWHNVTVIIQNDWVQYYMDGKLIDIVEHYSYNGTGGMAPVMTNFQPWKMFNKGAGSRYGYGIAYREDFRKNYTSYATTTIMEWITAENVDVTIGGGNIAGDAYNMLADTDEILIKNVVFYDEILTNEQIEYLASTPNYYGCDYDGFVGDVNLDKKISCRDALLILKQCAKVVDKNEIITSYGDVNKDNCIDVNDALGVLKHSAGLLDIFKN